MQYASCASVCSSKKSRSVSCTIYLLDILDRIDDCLRNLYMYYFNII